MQEYISSVRKIKKKLSNKETCIYTIAFLGKKVDWESWSEKFLSCGKHKGYKKLLVSNGSMEGVDKIPMHDDNDHAKGDTALDSKVIK